jgi:hypothetical protein
MLTEFLVANPNGIAESLIRPRNYRHNDKMDLKETGCLCGLASTSSD